MYVMIREVENSLHKLKYIKEEGRKNAIDAIKEIGKPAADPTVRVDRYLEYFTIGPQGMDPSGIVYKLDHILDVRDERLKEEVKLMAPASDEVQVNNLENTLEAAMALNYIYKVVRHYYIQGKKTLSLYVIMQLQMILPMVMKEAEAYASALKSLRIWPTNRRRCGTISGCKTHAWLRNPQTTKRLCHGDSSIRRTNCTSHKS